MIATAPTRPATERKPERYESGYTPWGCPCSVKRDDAGRIESAYSGTGNVPTRDLSAIRVKTG